MDRIGKYTIEKKLGQGGMGIVYKCLDTELKRFAAVKVLPQQLASDPAFLQRFKREVLTLQRLNHPHIVRVYDQGEIEGSFYYAMEFIDGSALDSILASGEPMQPLRAIRIIRACAEALDHSHSQGIVHRDIKPANIMVTQDDVVKLTDFGIAKLLDATRMTATSGVLGTVEYMSPEQSQGRHVDGRSDLYSLGVVLYQCVTGRLPITGNTPTDVIMKLRTHQVDPPSSWVPTLPRSLDDLMSRLLAKDSAKRVESAKELLRELERVEKQIITGFSNKATSRKEAIISSGATSSAWHNPWMIVFVIGVVGFSTWFFFKGDSTKKEDLAAASNAGASVTEEDVGRPQFLMLRWAQKARAQKKFDYATDLNTLIIKYFPNSTQAELAIKELDYIKEGRKLQETEEALKQLTGDGGEKKEEAK